MRKIVKQLQRLHLIMQLSLLILSCNSANNEPNQHSLTGSWQFVADQLMDSAGLLIKQDTAVTGLLVYTTEGQVSVQFLWKGTRAPVLNDTLMNNDGVSNGLGLGFNTWDSEVSRRLIDTYDAYFGDYRVDWNTNAVTHVVKGCLRPEKEGAVHKRIFQLKDDSLFLRSADPEDRWRAACVRNK